MPEELFDREETIRRIMRRMEEKLRRDLVTDPQTLDEIEEQSEQIGEEFKRIIEQERLTDQTSGYQGSHAGCDCGQMARYIGLRPRQIITRHGVQTFCRAYYHCGACHRGWCPTDQALGIGAGQCSRQVSALIARFCSYLPYRTAAQELEAICHIRLSVRTLQRHAQQVGLRLREDWARKQIGVWEGRPVPTAERPSRLHVTMDGVLVHVGGEWREVKLGCAYQKTARGVSARYYATLEQSTAFGKKVRTLAQQSGSDYCSDIAVIADGGPWIWQETGKYFPTSVQILDFYHATEHLWQAAHARFGEGSIESKDWMRQQKDRLMHDQAETVLQEIKDWKPGKAEHQEIQRKLIGYLTTHQHRMCYQTREQQGYHIGSGVIEAGCKHVVQARMKGVGMRWKQQGAEAMLHLCAHWKSAGNDGFYPYTGPRN